MIQARFTQQSFDADSQQWVTETVAELVADGSTVTVSGDRADWIDRDIPIRDPENGDQVDSRSNPERWARLLPLAYRSGDIDVEVTEVAVAAPMPDAAFQYPA